MPSHGPSSPNHQQGTKRQRQSWNAGALDASSPQSPNSRQLSGDTPRTTASNSTSKAGQGSNFRNVSACNRCRLRKNRCDQKLPSCASCTRAGLACVGYDPITKKEIPRRCVGPGSAALDPSSTALRTFCQCDMLFMPHTFHGQCTKLPDALASYVFYLETRVEQLEKLLTSKNVAFPPAEDLEVCSRPSAEATNAVSTAESGHPGQSEAGNRANARQHQALEVLKVKRDSQSPALANIINPPKTRSLASASGVSFASVVFAAVQYSVSEQTGTGQGIAGRKPSSGTSMRDSFFGLHTRPSIQPAPFPEKEEGLRLATLYFEHANPQIPVLHRVEFMQTFEKAYKNAAKALAARELYMINMVFAIGAGVILGEPVRSSTMDGSRLSLNHAKSACQPEEYHASATVHLEECLSTSGGYLEVLQAVLLLANFALLRPVPPGLWYITGVAARLAVDLGVHHEDGGDMEAISTEPSAHSDAAYASEMREGGAQDRGRRLWARDMRRRLWWCTYTFDRLVSTCVGRPFGISDEIITTELPSLLDDEYITRSGFVEPPDGQDHPSYKRVAHHYFRLRLLQSEILQVLQHNQAQLARATNRASRKTYPEMRRHLASPFLVRFDSFRLWRMDIDGRLFAWKTSAPTREETGVAFSTEFLELNYWQAIILLYRQSLSVPAMFEGEYNPSDEVNNSPSAFTAELQEDEDCIYLKVAEAGQKIVRIYRQLHLSGLVSYTYLSTHHLFMAGISYLYAIWHSSVVRSRLTMDEVDFTVLAAKSVFSDMIEKCPPAETCRDAFDRTAKTTMKMATSNGGFGAPCEQQQPRRQRRETVSCSTVRDGSSSMTAHGRHQHRRSEQTPSQFDASMSNVLPTPGFSLWRETVSGQGPLLAREGVFDGDGLMRGQRPARSGSSQGDRMRRDDASWIDACLVRPPAMTRRSAPFMDQHFGLSDSRDYADGRAMDMLHNLGAGAHSELNSSAGDLDNIHPGFGLNWDGLHNEYGEGQHMNPFDTFFFGGQQGSAGAGHDGNDNGNND